MKTIIAIVFAASLAACAHGPQLSAKPPVQHHVKRAAPVIKPPVVVPPVAPPVVAPAPQAAPTPEQSFKHRWLRLFFRERALSK